MKKEFRIKDTREFGSIIGRKRFYTCPSFTIYVKERAQDHARIGISVGKKLGNAVMRNKVKRQIRSMVREIYTFEEKLTVNLAKTAGDSTNHFALFSVSLSMNKKNKDYEAKNALISTSETYIKEIVSDEFGKYTLDTVKKNKEVIKQEILNQLKEYFNSDFIVSISFGDLLVQ